MRATGLDDVSSGGREVDGVIGSAYGVGKICSMVDGRGRCVGGIGRLDFVGGVTHSPLIHYCGILNVILYRFEAVAWVAVERKCLFKNWQNFLCESQANFSAEKAK